MMLSVFACLSGAIDLNPDLTFEDCLPVRFTKSEYPVDVMDCVGATNTDFAQVKNSHIFFFHQEDTEQMVEKVRTDEWLPLVQEVENMRVGVALEAGRSNDAKRAEKVAELLGKKTIALGDDADTKTYDAFQGVENKITFVVDNITESLDTALEKLRSLSNTQKRTLELAVIFRRLLGHMNGINGCNINLAKIGKSLFLNGESGNSSEVLAECVAILDSNITAELKNYSTSNRRQLGSSESQPLQLEYGLVYPDSFTIDIPACLAMANHPKCAVEAECMERDGLLFHAIEKQCIHFVYLVRNYRRDLQADSYLQGLEKLSAWLDILIVQASDVADSTATCAANAKTLFNLNEQNVKNLARSVKCAELGVAEWNKIVKECLAANDISRIYIPYYNIVTLLNASQCVSLMNGIIAVAISFGATFMLYILWSICKSCGLCKKNQQQQQSLPMYMNPYGGMPPFAMPSPQVQWQASSSPSRLEILDAPEKRTATKKKPVRSARAAGA